MLLEHHYWVMCIVLCLLLCIAGGVYFKTKPAVQCQPCCCKMIRAAALYLQAVTLLESMVTDPWKEGYCILTPSYLLCSSCALSLHQTGLMQTEI